MWSEGDVKLETQSCTVTHRQTHNAYEPQTQCLTSTSILFQYKQDYYLHTHTKIHTNTCAAVMGPWERAIGVTKHNDYPAHTASGSSPIIGFRWNQDRLITRPETVLLLSCVRLFTCVSNCVEGSTFFVCRYCTQDEMFVKFERMFCVHVCVWMFLKMDGSRLICSFMFMCVSGNEAHSPLSLCPSARARGLSRRYEVHPQTHTHT